MSTQGSTALEKAEVHTESLQQVQPIDLAARNAGGQVVQLRPVRAFSTAHVTAKSVGGPTGVGGLTAVNAPIISVNRPGNLTLLPTRAGTATAAQPVSGTQVTQAISTYQIARVGNMRSATLSSGQQPNSITVTPISASNFSANIRLAGATVNNGSWIQTNSAGQGGFGTPIRAIAVGGRPVRPETAKMIHIPQQGSVQHVAQLQMVDGKGSILKPQITTTPIVNIRGALQGGSTTGQSMTLPIAPFTIRTANIANLNTLQRPQASSANNSNPVQKVITQPTHGTPIQFVNTNKNVIQAITPLPRLNVNAMNAVCLTLSTNAATLAPNSSSPVVAVASKQGATSLIMTPALATGTGTNLPITKVIPVGRDGSTASIVDSLFAQPIPSTSNAVTVSAVSASGTQVSNNSGHGHNMTSANVVLAASTSNASHGASNNNSVSITQSQSHHLLHVQGPINVHPANASSGLPPQGLGTSGYFVEKNGNLSLLQTNPQTRPITLEKRTDGKGIPTGSMILTTQHPHIQSGNGGQGATMTIPIASAHGTQHVSFAHHLSMSHSGGQHQLPPSAQIIATPISAQAHHIASTVLSTMASTPAISVSASPSHHISLPPGGVGMPHAIPTHVISQPQQGTISIVSSSSNPLCNITVTTTAGSTNSGLNTNSLSTGSAINVSITNTSTTINSTSTSSTCSTATTSSNSNSLSTAAPAQSPNTKSATHSPRPSILRKQRELGDNHHIPSRSQRNLSLQLNFSGNNNSNSSSLLGSNITSASAASVTATVNSIANKENAGAVDRGPPPVGSNCGNNQSSSCPNISRKEFQPPNEETSWQSCSSHSSGSTTISATSETAEYQMNQPTSSNSGGGSAAVDITVNVSSKGDNSSGNGSIHPSSFNYSGSSGAPVVTGNTNTPISQNGVVRSITSSSQGRSANRTSSKLQNRNIERLKQDKDDGVSPRKKPRKQQLTTSDFLEAPSPEISFYQGRGKKFKKMENNIFDGYNQSKSGIDASAAEDITPSPMAVVLLKKPRMSLVSSSQMQLGKIRLNHFEHYSEVKSKEERKPNISELANQKNIVQKVSGWKIERMTNQMEQVIDLEVSVVNSFNALLTRLESKVGPSCPDRDINRILELLKGNIQRCKVIRDQMSESRLQTLRILEHKPKVIEVINKHMAKKNPKKRDRL